MSKDMNRRPENKNKDKELFFLKDQTILKI